MIRDWLSSQVVIKLHQKALHCSLPPCTPQKDSCCVCVCVCVRPDPPEMQSPEQRRERTGQSLDLARAPPVALQDKGRMPLHDTPAQGAAPSCPLVHGRAVLMGCAVMLVTTCSRCSERAEASAQCCVMMEDTDASAVSLSVQHSQC